MTRQHPLVHWLSFRHVAAQTETDGFFVSKTHVLPLQHPLTSLVQLCPGARQAGAAASGAASTPASAESSV